MVQRNVNFSKLAPHYLFYEIKKKVEKYLAENKDVKLIRLGIGDTTEPIPFPIAKALSEASIRLSTKESYTGYGEEKGQKVLRQAISREVYGGKIPEDSIFISDGTKCDIGRLQQLFGPKITIAVQDPAYPAYVDTSRLLGQEEIIYLPVTPENAFFPDLEKAKKANVIFFCSPNNPTGIAATKAQLKHLIDFAKSQKSIIIFDAAYASFIRDSSLPRSIFEIEGATSQAIEMGSFSKMAGFTGVRLGWTVVSPELCYEDGTSIQADWQRIHSTFFNGASNIAQSGGLAALTQEGQKQTRLLTDFYLENNTYLIEALKVLDVEIFGGKHAPYLWVRIPNKTSWEAFDFFLKKIHIVTTPGVGFGQGGEGFIRLSAFASRPAILEAASRLYKLKIK